jgi:hypothetical protein
MQFAISHPLESLYCFFNALLTFKNSNNLYMFSKSVIGFPVSKDGKNNKLNVLFHLGSLFSIDHLLKQNQAIWWHICFHS